MKKNMFTLLVTFMFATMQTKAQCVHLALGTFYPKANTTGALFDSLEVIVSQCNANTYNVYNNGTLYAPGYIVTVTGTNPATNTGSKKIAVLPLVPYLLQVKTADGVCFSNYVAYNFSVLPVKLLLFNATASDNKVKVTWTVESDQDADSYVVERSTDGRNFTEVGLVFAVNQTSKQDYSFTNSALPIGVYYYRLKMVNKDAKIEYSSIARVEIGSKYLGMSITVMPNPVVSNLVLRLDGKALTSAEKIRISDITGKVIMSTTTQNSTVDVQHLSPGTYILEIISANNPSNTIKFVKQ